ncbi:MAG: hypothetical protein LBJ69_03155 [Holosporales bacterium]|nr:hypothetical protein [Holosporales bacterium]
MMGPQQIEACWLKVDHGTLPALEETSSIAALVRGIDPDGAIFVMGSASPTTSGVADSETGKLRSTGSTRINLYDLPIPDWFAEFLQTDGDDSTVTELILVIEYGGTAGGTRPVWIPSEADFPPDLSSDPNSMERVNYFRAMDRIIEAHDAASHALAVDGGLPNCTFIQYHNPDETNFWHAIPPA